MKKLNYKKSNNQENIKIGSEEFNHFLIKEYVRSLEENDTLRACGSIVMMTFLISNNEIDKSILDNMQNVVADMLQNKKIDEDTYDVNFKRIIYYLAHSDLIKRMKVSNNEVRDILQLLCDCENMKIDENLLKYDEVINAKN